MSKQAICKQINYYLSTENLQNDEFFYNLVAENPENYVALNHFLNCNKLKKLGVKDEKQIIDAVTDSADLQLNPEKNMLRRKGDHNLPQNKPKKKTKSEDHADIPVNPYNKLETTIFVMSLANQQKVPFRYIQQALLKNLNVYSPYVRFNNTEGHFAVQNKICTPQIIQLMTKQGLKIGEAHIKIQKAEGEALALFWEKHGHHYNTIIDNLRKDFDKKAKQQKRSVSKNKKIAEFEFCGQKYDDINKLKSLFKNLLYRSPNNVALNVNDAKLITELLGYHVRGQQKLKDMKHFVVDVHPTHVDTRCFFVVKNDGSREDFSMVKCLQRLEDKFAIK